MAARTFSNKNSNGSYTVSSSNNSSSNSSSGKTYSGRGDYGMSTYNQDRDSYAASQGGATGNSTYNGSGSSSNDKSNYIPFTSKIKEESTTKVAPPTASESQRRQSSYRDTSRYSLGGDGLLVDAGFQGTVNKASLPYMDSERAMMDEMRKAEAAGDKARVKELGKSIDWVRGKSYFVNNAAENGAGNTVEGIYKTAGKDETAAMTHGGNDAWDARAKFGNDRGDMAAYGQYAFSRNSPADMAGRLVDKVIPIPFLSPAQGAVNAKQATDRYEAVNKQKAPEGMAVEVGLKSQLPAWMRGMMGVELWNPEASNITSSDDADTVIQKLGIDPSSDQAKEIRKRYTSRFGGGTGLLGDLTYEATN